jgi:hypothetical protein
MGKLVLVRSIAPVTLVVGLSVALVLALAGPFGTYHEMSLPVRLGYWGLIVLTSIPFGHAARLVVAVARPGTGVPEAVLLPSALMVLGYTPVLYGIVRHIGGATGTATEVLVWLAGLVAIVSICVNAVRWSLGFSAGASFAQAAGPVAVPGTVVAPELAPPRDSALAPDTAAPPPPAAPLPPRIASRLGDLPCIEVLRLSARDHYVDVVTRCATKPLLLRLSDAMTEVEGIPGAQVHRSHWVARAAVVQARRDGGRIVLVLVDGTVVPVSRGYRDRAEAAGLLTGLDRPALAAAE